MIAQIINKEENNLKGDIYSSSLLGTIYKIKININMFSITIRYTSKPNWLNIFLITSADKNTQIKMTKHIYIDYS